MPILLVVLLIAVLAFAWVSRRGSTLTRSCRWRQDRRAGGDVWRCAACGAVMHRPDGRAPNACLRDHPEKAG